MTELYKTTHCSGLCFEFHYTVAIYLRICVTACVQWLNSLSVSKCTQEKGLRWHLIP